MSGRVLQLIDGDEERRGRKLRAVRTLLTWAFRVAFAGMALVLVPAAFSAANGPSDWEGWRPGPAEAGRSATLPFPDAIAAGREPDGVLYACRGLVNGDMHVGRIRGDFAGCHVGYGGKEIEIKPFEVLSLSWKPAEAGPAGALVAGTEWAPGVETPFTAASLFICRASFQGGVHSGQARAGQKGCSFGFGGKRIVVGTYELLQASPWLGWVPATSGNLPDSAVVSGNEGGENFYACRAQDKNGLHPGKVKRGPIGCGIVSNGREATLDRFEVLAPRWKGGHAGTSPVGGFLAGRENGEGQFVCRAPSRDGNRDAVQLGKVSDALGGCHVGMRGAEVVIADYEVLSQ